MEVPFKVLSESSHFLVLLYSERCSLGGAWWHPDVTATIPSSLLSFKCLGHIVRYGLLSNLFSSNIYVQKLCFTCKFLDFLVDLSLYFTNKCVHLNTLWLSWGVEARSQNTHLSLDCSSLLTFLILEDDAPVAHFPGKHWRVTLRWLSFYLQAHWIIESLLCFQAYKTIMPEILTI